MSDDEGFFLLLVTPPLSSEDAPVAKDVIMVLDTSGSMEGQKLDQAKAAAKYVLNHLDAEDRFNIVSFSSAVHAFEASPVPVGRRADGLQFIDGLRAARQHGHQPGLARGRGGRRSARARPS